MKIAYITDCIGDKISGIGVYAKGLIWALSQYSKENIESRYIDYKKTDFNKIKLFYIDNKFRIARTYLWYFFIPFVIRNQDFDYVFNFNMIPSPFAYRQKEIFVVHDLILSLFSQYHPWQRVLMNKLFMKKTLKRAHKILVNSEFTKRDLLKLYPELEKKTHKIFIPYMQQEMNNKKKQPSFLKENQPYIFNLNTLEPRKNIVNLILAFERLKKQFMLPHKLIIAGQPGWLYKDIFDLRERSSFKKEIILTGYISEGEKKYLYSHASVFVYPSLYEGIGIPILEAMNNNCPVIASNRSSIPEIANGAALLFNPDSVEDLSNAILKLIRDPIFSKELKAKGKKRVKELNNLSKIKKEIADLIKFINL